MASKAKCGWWCGSWLTGCLALLLMMVAAAPPCSAAPRISGRGLTVRTSAGPSHEVLEFDQGMVLASPPVCGDFAVPTAAEWLAPASEAIVHFDGFRQSLQSRAPPAR